MTALSTSILFAAVVLAALNWVSVARGNKALEYFSKPATTVALIALVATFDVSHNASWGWRLAALMFCLFGDVFLMLPRDAFVPGLASFAVGQILFTVSFWSSDVSVVRFVVGVLVLVPLAALLARRFVAALRRAGRNDLVVPVICYLLVITAMSTSAIGDGNAIAIAGAITFMVSDSLIAESRFVKAKAWHPVGIMVTYHLALAGLVFGLL